MEHASFTPLVFSATGDLANEANTFYKRLASLLASKWIIPTAVHYAGYTAVWRSLSCAPQSSPLEELNHRAGMPSRPPPWSISLTLNRTSRLLFNSWPQVLFYLLCSFCLDHHYFYLYSVLSFYIIFIFILLRSARAIGTKFTRNVRTQVYVKHSTRA